MMVFIAKKHLALVSFPTFYEPSCIYVLLYTSSVVIAPILIYTIMVAVNKHSTQ
jgi:hypothetical protein